MVCFRYPAGSGHSVVSEVAMEIIKKTLTLEHFFDNPQIAAAAGYDFNIVDCMSFAANRMSGTGVKWEILTDLGHTEIADWRGILLSLASLIIATLWPFFYPIMGVLTYWHCKKSVRKYRFSTDITVKRNINRWLMSLKD